jgi:hypothetical protein
MDAGAAVKPVGGISVTDYARPASAATPGTAAPDLPGPQTASPALDVSHKIPTEKISANSYITREITIDPQSREVIYRVIDTRTRQVLWQLPDAALMRTKAYAQTLSEASQSGHSKNQTDIRG